MTMDLIKIIQSGNLDQVRIKNITEQFEEYQQTANHWASIANEIEVNDISQTEAMKKADDARKIIKALRVDIEKRRKALKEDSLREGQMIDAIAKAFTALLTPIEEDLTKKAKFKELYEAEQREKLYQDRIALMFNTDPTCAIDKNMLVAMDEQSFMNYYEGFKLDYNRKMQEVKAAEELRIQQEKAEAEEREKNRLEVIRLKAELDAKSKEVEIEKAKILQEIEESKISELKSEHIWTDDLVFKFINKYYLPLNRTTFNQNLSEFFNL